MFFFSVLFIILKPYDTSGLLHGEYIIEMSVVTVIIFIFQYYFRRRYGEVFGETDRYIFLIMLAFLNKKSISDTEKLTLLKYIFSSYSEPQTENLFNKYKNENIEVEYLCTKLLKTGTKTRLFILYSLFNLASSDKILRKEENDFILRVSKLLKIPQKIYDIIKRNYVRRGLADEEEIKRKAEQEKFTKNMSNLFFPYEAYRILGVSPSVTKLQLKKIYRTLAKKYHPDKFAGESEDKIKDAERKFQEIKEAYEIIKKNKKF